MQLGPRMVVGDEHRRHLASWPVPCACPLVGSLTYKSAPSVEEPAQAHLQAHRPFTYSDLIYALDLRIVYTIRWFALANSALDMHGSQMLLPD